MALVKREAPRKHQVHPLPQHAFDTSCFFSFLRVRQVILLTMGQTAYFGPAVDSLAHFASLGHEPKGMINPADYLLEVSDACYDR